jgi:hypothetical protein
MISNKCIQHIIELLSRNIATEIAEFIKSHACDIDYKKAAKVLLDYYLEQHDLVKFEALASTGLIDTFSLAKQAVKSPNLEVLCLLLSYTSKKNKDLLLNLATHLVNDDAVKALLDGGADISTRYNNAIYYIVYRFNLVEVKKHLDKFTNSALVNKVPDLISYASANSSEDTLKYLISRGLDPHLSEGIPLIRALVGLNIPAIKFLISLEQPRPLSTVEKVKVKSAIKKNSTPFDFLKKLKEEEESLITIALETYFSQTKKTPLQYLKKCPQWQKTHVIEYMQRNM